MSFNSFYANSCLSPKDVEKSNAFFKIVPYDEEINSGKQNVLTKIQYYDTLNTLPQHSWRMSLWSEWELELQRLITVVKCMHFFILRKKHCSIFVNIFYNKRCNYWLCGVYWITWLMISYEGLKTALIINLFWRLHLGEKVSISLFFWAPVDQINMTLHKQLVLLAVLRVSVLILFTLLLCSCLW